MINKNNKGQIWNYLIGAIIALIVVIVVVLIFRGGAEKSSDTFIDALGQTKDCDKDKFPDLTDKCPCDPNVGDEWTTTVTNPQQCNPVCTPEIRQQLQC